MTTKLSPVELKPYVMVVLGSLLTNTTDFVETDKILETLCANLGIEETAWGIVESQKNKPSWMRWNTIRAIRYLREDGKAESRGRGKYGLTDKGLGVKKTEDVEEVVAEPTAVNPKFVSDIGVSWSIGDIPEDTYHEDESVRELGIKGTSCFGYWADRSPTCKVCPLAGSCKRGSFLAFVEIAEGLDLLENEPKELSDIASEKGEQIKEVLEEPTETAENPNEKVLDPSCIIPAPCELKCDVCGEEIATGEKAYWEVNKGKKPIHLACAT